MRIYEFNATADQTLTTTTETQIAQLGNICSQSPGQQIYLSGSVNVTAGGSTTGFTLRFREDSLTGNVIDELSTDTLASATGSPEDHEIRSLFTIAGELSGKVIVLTIQQVGAVANGTVNHANMRGDLLP